MYSTAIKLCIDGIAKTRCLPHSLSINLFRITVAYVLQVDISQY
jgi:hypothetical protein